MPRVILSFSDGEFEPIVTAAQKIGVPVNQFLKDLILSVDLSNLSNTKLSFTHEHDDVVSAIKMFIASHPVGTRFSLREIINLKGATVNENGKLIPNGVKPALGRAILADVKNGKIPGVKVAYNINKAGEQILALDRNKALIYEICEVNE